MKGKIVRVLSALVCSLSMLAFSTTGMAEAAEEKENISFHGNCMLFHEENIRLFTGSYSNEVNVKLLHDLNGNEFQLVETGERGYYIFDEVSGKYLEQAPESPSPYLGIEDNLYYFGPMNYYQEIDGVFRHTFLTEEASLSLAAADSIQDDFGDKIDKVRETVDLNALSILNQTNAGENRIREGFAEAKANYVNTYVPNYSYIKNAIYPENKNGTCGYTAACIVLNYWHKSGYDVIDSVFLDKNGNLKTEDDDFTLQDQLLEYGKTNDSTGMKISNVVNQYCTAYGISASATYHLLANSVYEEMEAGHPVIIFGSFPDVSDVEQPRIMHAMTFYGEHKVGSAIYMIVHYGWSGYEHVIVEEGMLGSSTLILPD